MTDREFAKGPDMHAEASDLGWEPGHWPKRFGSRTSAGPWEHFVFQEFDNDGSAIYLSNKSGTKLTVFND